MPDAPRSGTRADSTVWAFNGSTFATVFFIAPSGRTRRASHADVGFHLSLRNDRNRAGSFSERLDSQRCQKLLKS